jgi:hypothetical protein
MHPRGNTMILVTAILVLLVIIATAFLSRTQAARQVSAAQQQAGQRDDRALGIANELADLIGQSLFPQPVDPGTAFRSDPNDPDIRTAVSSWPRLATPSNARRYGIDRDFDNDAFPDVAYNAATYAVSPWTNWPDFLSDQFPRGPGQPNGIILNSAGTPIGDGNPYGNPGFGDTRWLRSTEPIRVDSDNDGVPDTFSHWAHLSWIPTANNGWRVVSDISDIMDSSLTDGDPASLLTNMNETEFNEPFALGMPYEQWLSNIFPNTTAAGFEGKRNAWFGLPAQYAQTYSTGNALPNFFRLSALSANPVDEFVPGTTRNLISRTFTDTDGDGFTDSFWFLAPTSVERGVRTVVGVSIVDNSGLLNVNAATRFDRTNTAGTTPGDLALVSDFGTGVGFLDTPTNSMEGGGSNFTLWPANPNGLYPPIYVGWNQAYFGDLDNPGDGLSFLQAVGMKNPINFDQPNAYLSDSSLPADRRGEFLSPLERLGYFRSLVNPLEPQYGLTPFGTAEELELRMYHGNNHPFIMSRFERSLNRKEPQPGSNFSERWFLRSSPARAETSEYLDQLNAQQLLLDNRRKLTMFSGSRNDLLPPWLWPSPFFNLTIDYNRDNAVSLDPDTGAENPDATAGDLAAYERQLRKLDLRRAMDDAGLGQAPPSVAQIEENRRQWRIDLNRILERTLTRTWGEGADAKYQSYLGPRDETNVQDQRTAFQKTRSMVASLTANIDQARDRGEVTIANVVVDQPIHPVLGIRDPIDPDLVYIGQEKQPFIMEVFFALVYPKSKISLPLKQALQAAGLPVPSSDFDIPSIFDDGGENFVDSSSKPIPVIAVQIANPYDTPINLADFRLRVFGKVYNFNATPQPDPSNPSPFESYGIGPVLGPATRSGPSTAIVYAMKAPTTEQLNSFPTGWNAVTFKEKWRDFLDIDDLALFNSGDPTRRTLRFDASVVWTSEDTPSPAASPASGFNDDDAHSVELVRNVVGQPGPGAPTPVPVVVDRFDNYTTADGLRFAESVARLFTDERLYPPVQDFELNQSDPDRSWMNGIRLADDDFYVSWTRASRLWSWDVPKDIDGDGAVTLEETDELITPDEENPRWIFSFASKPVRPTGAVRAHVSGADRDNLGNTVRGNQLPDPPSPDQLWISFTYRNIFGATRRGKPVFFSNQVVQPEGPRGDGENAYGGGFAAPDLNGNYPGNVVFGDKGFQEEDWREALKRLSLRSPLQMLHKDADFAQAGEVLNVFCWGPVIDLGNGPPETEKTFSEIMLQEGDDEDQPVGRGIFVNRLRMIPYLDPVIEAEAALRNDPQATDGPTAVLGTPPNAPYVPALPAGTALLDALVCDDRGLNQRLDGLDGSVPNGIVSQTELNAAERFRPRNAVAFTGLSTPGLINLNTALPEVLRAMPQMHFLVSNPTNFGTAGAPDAVVIPLEQEQNKYVRVVDSILRYRDRTLAFQPGVIIPNGTNGDGIDANLVPGYADRGIGADDLPGSGLAGFLGPVYEGNDLVAQGMRNERGIQSVGELMLLQRVAPANANDLWSQQQSFSIQYLGLDPYRSSVDDPGSSGFAYANGFTPRFSTDLQNGQIGSGANQRTVPDRVAGDAEKRNLLFSGISNLLTTRSDVFTVYFRVRSVRQDPVTLKWDGTNPDLIVDDSRYVMTVDRGGVDRPGQRPKILMLEKCPD